MKKKNKDVFASVETEAKEVLNNPFTAGAAKTVLEYIARHRNDR